MREYKVGAQLWTVRDHIGTIEEVRTTLNRIADIGYEAVETVFLKPLPVEEINEAIAAAGLEVAGTFVDWKRLLNEPDAALADYKKWNCQNLVLGGLPPEYYNDAGLAQFLGELPVVGGKLRAANLNLVYHNHSHEFIRVGKHNWLSGLYEDSDPADLKAEIDVYWVQHGGGDPADWLRRCADRVEIIHLKDMTITLEREQRFAEVGEGNLNWDEIFEAAAQTEAAWYVVEQDLCYGRDPFESLEISFRNLEEMGVV